MLLLYHLVQYLNQILDGSSFGIFSSFWYFKNTHPKDFAFWVKNNNWLVPTNKCSRNPHFLWSLLFVHDLLCFVLCTRLDWFVLSSLRWKLSLQLWRLYHIFNTHITPIFNFRATFVSVPSLITISSSLIIW